MTLVDSSVIDRIQVIAAVELLDQVRAALGGQPPNLVEVTTTPRIERADVVVVHDPHFGSASPALVRRVVEGCWDNETHPEDVGWAAAAAVGPVTDTLVWVDADHVIRGQADRSRYRTVLGLHAYRREAYRREAFEAVNVGSVLDAGGRVRAIDGEPADSDALSRDQAIR